MWRLYWWYSVSITQGVEIGEAEGVLRVSLEHNHSDQHLSTGFWQGRGASGVQSWGRSVSMSKSAGTNSGRRVWCQPQGLGGHGQGHLFQLLWRLLVLQGLVCLLVAGAQARVNAI